MDTDLRRFILIFQQVSKSSIHEVFKKGILLILSVFFSVHLRPTAVFRLKKRE